MCGVASGTAVFLQGRCLRTGLLTPLHRGLAASLRLEYDKKFIAHRMKCAYCKCVLVACLIRINVRGYPLLFEWSCNWVYAYQSYVTAYVIHMLPHILLLLLFSYSLVNFPSPMPYSARIYIAPANAWIYSSVPILALSCRRQSMSDILRNDCSNVLLRLSLTRPRSNGAKRHQRWQSCLCFCHPSRTWTWPCWIVQNGISIDIAGCPSLLHHRAWTLHNIGTCKTAPLRFRSFSILCI